MHEASRYARYYELEEIGVVVMVVVAVVVRAMVVQVQRVQVKTRMTRRYKRG